MKTYKYTDSTNTVVFVIDEDGKCRLSMLASALPEGTEILPADVIPAPIPTIVSMRQARLALLQSGLLSSVDAAIATLPSPQKEAAQIEWEYSQEVHRDKALVGMLAPALGLNESQLDDLFTLAATL